jgi:hypothetical protein
MASGRGSDFPLPFTALFEVERAGGVGVVL